MLHSSTVIRELLQSCYTGILQFSAKEIVNYLTAASYLQMEHVVEKCRVALSQYLQSKSSSSGVSQIPSRFLVYIIIMFFFSLCTFDSFGCCVYSTVTCSVCKNRRVSGYGGDRQRKHSRHVATFRACIVSAASQLGGGAAGLRSRSHRCSSQR